MTPSVAALIADVVDARERFIAQLGAPTPAQAAFRAEPDDWSLTDITEHMTLAERSGLSGLWKATDGVRRGVPVWSGEPVHRGKSVEQVVDETWRAQEQVPAIAAPSWAGPIAYWIVALRSGQPVLEALGRELESLQASGVSLDSVIYPHPISGPMDAWQRLAFLRFHLDRHTEQVRRIQQHPQFPSAPQSSH